MGEIEKLLQPRLSSLISREFNNLYLTLFIYRVTLSIIVLIFEGNKIKDQHLLGKSLSASHCGEDYFSSARRRLGQVLVVFTRRAVTRDWNETGRV